jgi:hypothetical protein
MLHAKYIDRSRAPERFRENDISEKVLPSLTAEDLKELVSANDEQATACGRIVQYARA